MYQSKVIEIGPLVEEMAQEGGFVIVFNEGAPDALAEMAVLHTKCEVTQDLKAGDVVRFGDNVYTITAVGDEANHTFSTMGHCSFKFTGHPEVELPGQIELDGCGVVPEIKAGDRFEIEYQ
ncbi:MAG: PTS glucitol/sorbitol transporter subunit IIA [Eubacteriaceae bacterium]|jgi:PTS system glucitol/sorbitol-specific IIA component|nr:PTS glucitol/sorbitol transporter subunit IIA [Eubacteriaceae bacterium]